MMNLGEKMTELECDALVDVSKQCTTDACDFYSKTQFVSKLDLDILSYVMRLYTHLQYIL